MQWRIASIPTGGLRHNRPPDEAESPPRNRWTPHRAAACRLCCHARLDPRRLLAGDVAHRFGPCALPRCVAVSVPRRLSRLGPRLQQVAFSFPRHRPSTRPYGVLAGASTSRRYEHGEARRPARQEPFNHPFPFSHKDNDESSTFPTTRTSWVPTTKLPSGGVHDKQVFFVNAARSQETPPF